MEKRSKDTDDPMQLDKSQVLQEARQRFTARSENPKKLIDTLTKCILLLLQGEQLDNNQASQLFLQITQLFQYKNSNLKRLIYIGIKLLAPQVENVFVVTSSLMNDITSSEDPSLKAAALRALCQISTNLPVYEQCLKQCIDDKDAVVASAAIISLNRINDNNPEFVKNCTQQIRKALRSNSHMVQYHALILMHNIYKNDIAANRKLIKDCIQQGLESPLAVCVLLRILTKYMNENDSEDKSEYKTYMRSQLTNESKTVEYEAAHAIINTKSISNESIEYKSAVSHLRNFLTSSEAALRFASVRSLNELATTSSSDIRFWSVHRIGSICKLHLLNKRFRIGDHIIGMLDFSNSTAACAKYTVILHCEETQQYELKQEFALGMRKKDFMITIPPINTEMSVLHCVLSFLFYIGVKNYPKTLYEDKAGTIELGPSELETKLFSCDFPIAVHA